MDKSVIASLHTQLVAWYKNTDERAKLQHSYLAIALSLVVVAGIIGLMNYQYGQALLQIAFGAFAAFLVNAFMWALLQSFVFTRLETKARQNKRK